MGKQVIWDHQISHLFLSALPGSSGSAVVNHKGQLVAINYAGVSTTQSFNYGIRVKYLKSLMKNLASGMDDDDDF